MKAIKILKKIYKNNPDTRIQRNNVDVNFTIHDFNNIKEAIKELAIKELEVLENRSCENCKYLYNQGQGFGLCNKGVSNDFKIGTFCCNKWGNKS